MTTALARYRWWTAVSVLLILTGCLIALFVPAGLGWDFANFYDAGRRVAAGQYEDLYHRERLIAGQAPQGDMDFWGVPLSAVIYAPLSLFPPETALVLFKVQNILAYGLALALLFLHLRPLVGDGVLARWRFAAAFGLAALLYQPFWTVFRVGGQATSFVFLLCVVGLWAHSKGRFAWSSLVLAIVVMIKPALVLALVFLLLLSPLRFWWITAVYALLLGSLSLLLFGLDLHVELARKLIGGAAWIPPWKDNSSIYILFEHLRQWAAPASGGWVAATLTWAVRLVKVAVFATLLAVFRSSRNEQLPDQGRRRFTFDLALLFFLLFSNSVWEHYLALLFPFLALLLASREVLKSRAFAILVAILALSVLQNLIVSRFLVGSFAFDTLPALLLAVAYKSAPLWLVWFLLLRHRESVFAAYRGMTAERAAESIT